jgi:hypothetical protein
MAGCGLDVGTSYIVLSKEDNGKLTYKDFRDAFYVIKPTQRNSSLYFHIWK